MQVLISSGHRTYTNIETVVHNRSLVHNKNCDSKIPSLGKIEKEDKKLNDEIIESISDLRNLIDRIAILSPNNQDKISNIIKESLKKPDFDNSQTENSLSVPLKEARENFEKEYLTTQLKKFSGNISKTADFIGMERSALHRKLKGLGIKELN